MDRRPARRPSLSRLPDRVGNDTVLKIIPSSIWSTGASTTQCFAEDRFCCGCWVVRSVVLSFRHDTVDRQCPVPADSQQ